MQQIKFYSEESSLPLGQQGCALRNQRGVALIVAISLLAVMSILGILLLTATTSEIKLSGNQSNQQKAFNAADRAVEYAMQNATHIVGTIDLYHDSDGGVLHRDRIAIDNAGLEETPAAGEADKTDANTVTFLGSGPPPPDFISDAGEFQANYYSVTAVGISPLGAPNPSRAVIRSQVAKIIPASK